MIADIEELEEMDASEIHARRLIANELLTPIHLNQGSSSTEERKKKFCRRESDGLYSPTPFQDDSTRDDVEDKNDFWSITGDFILSPSRGTQSQTVHAERRIISHCTEVYRRNQNNTYVKRCIVGKTY